VVSNVLFKLLGGIFNERFLNKNVDKNRNKNRNKKTLKTFITSMPAAAITFCVKQKLKSKLIFFNIVNDSRR